jgi:hypothetical protein
MITACPAHPNVYPLSYCIPDECIATLPRDKLHVIAEVIPGRPETYRFGPGEEAEYDESYATSRFAITSQKGGWDCLRHYEILAAGAVPIFDGLERCPVATMTTFPKELVLRARQELLPWRAEKEALYAQTVRALLAHTREHCSSSSAARRVLGVFEARAEPSTRITRVLLLRANSGVNYSREFLWIGLARELAARGGRGLCWPDMDYLYEDSVTSAATLHGCGFKYTRRLPASLRADPAAFNAEQVTQEPGSASTPPSDEAVIRLIRARAFDVVLFGKVGPDEGPTGTAPHLPFWDEVYTNYPPHRIGFIYGGDGCQDLRPSSRNNRYAEHLFRHARFGLCFVRELEL